jgi:hypothetical protein
VEKSGGRNVSPDAAARLYKDFQRSREGQKYRHRVYAGIAS